MALNAFLATYLGWPGNLDALSPRPWPKRYKVGRKAHDRFYSGGGTFWITGFNALFHPAAGEFFPASYYRRPVTDN